MFGVNFMENNREYIGKRVAEIRQAKGLSIRQLADLCGVSAQNITKIEHGRYNVSIDILGKICEALGCRVDIVTAVNEVVITKEDMKKMMECFQGVRNKPDVVVKGSSLVEALNERIKK